MGFMDTPEMAVYDFWRDFRINPFYVRRKRAEHRARREERRKERRNEGEEMKRRYPELVKDFPGLFG